MFSVIQTATDIAGTASAWHLIEAAGFSGIVGVLWRFSNNVTQKIEAVRGNVRAVDTKLEAHLTHAPTLVTCANNIAHLDNVVQVEVEKLRDEVTALGIDRNGKAVDIQRRVNEVERWQSSHDGRVGGGE